MEIYSVLHFFTRHIFFFNTLTFNLRRSNIMMPHAVPVFVHRQHEMNSTDSERVNLEAFARAVLRARHSADASAWAQQLLAQELSSLP